MMLNTLGSKLPGNSRSSREGPNDNDKNIIREHFRHNAVEEALSYRSDRGLPWKMLFDIATEISR